MTARFCVLGATAAFLLVAVSASAHHSFAAEFDAENPVTLRGLLTKMEWLNPHSYTGRVNTVFVLGDQLVGKRRSRDRKAGIQVQRLSQERLRHAQTLLRGLCATLSGSGP